MTAIEQTVLSEDTQSLDDHAYERPCWDRGEAVAGVDEAGRGCLAGPVVAAAVIMPPNFRIEGVTDSKKLSAAKRNELVDQILETSLCWSIGICSPKEIDSLNILWASMEAMRKAIVGLNVPPDFVLIDGNTAIPNLSLPSKSIVKGDLKSHTIAAASILAKTHRDRIMLDLHAQHPLYAWNTNVGYPTAAHYEALRKHGPTPHHRTTFRLA
ncbi:ribonuclease HII [bacterium]|nr:ribonuclease HII [bacterium]